MLKILPLTEFDAFYQLLEQSFPEDEYRTYEEQKALLKDPRYLAFVLYGEGNALKALLTVWQLEAFAFIEHFAVHPNARNGGLGAGLLREVSGSLKKPICLEVERPDTELARRRIHFYERNHFFLNLYPYEQPPISKGKRAIPLYLMTYGAAVTEEEFLQIRKVLYREIYHCEEG